MEYRTQGRWSSSTISFVVAALFAVAGCGDSTVSSNTTIEEDTREDSNNETRPSLNDEYFMVAAGAEGLEANVTDAIDLKIFLYSKTTGEAVEGQEISFEITEGPNQTSLSAFNAETDAEGSATVELRTSAEPGPVTVFANHPSANGVEITVEVLPLETGDLDIDLVHGAPTILDLSDVDVRLYRASEMTCTEFRPLYNQRPELIKKTAAQLADPVVFEDLSVNTNYTLTAIARGPEGQKAAANCIEDVGVEADESRTVQMVLQLIPLNPVGRYDVTSKFDFEQAVQESGAVGATVVRVLNVFENPGQALYDEAMILLRNFVGVAGVAIDTFLSVTGIDNLIQNTINNFVENTEVLRRIRDAGRDVRDVIANLEVHSSLTIGKINSSYEFRGMDNWLGITLYWRWNCPMNAPDDCGAIDIVADESGNLGQLGVLSSEWDGRVVAYNQLQIDEHPLTIRYGRLIRYILNDVVLPELTGGNANSLSEAFAYWIGCGDLATSITGSDGEICGAGLCVYDSDIEGFCSTAVGTVFGFADALVRNLDFDIGLRLGGEDTLVEETSDGYVDRIVEGTYNGYMESTDDMGQTRRSPFTATWEAVKASQDTDYL
jgi:hypothetical protein